MRISVRRWVFSPSIPMMLITAVALAFFCALGQWQLQRAELKRHTQFRFEERLAEPFQFVKLDENLNHQLQYKKIELTGYYAPRFNFLLDNQVFEQRAGYHVLTPFFIHQRQAVLVNRGWVAVGDDRSVLPDIVPPKIDNRLQGIVTIPSSAGFRMGEVVMDGRWPQRIPYIDLAKMQQGVNFELLPYVIWLAEDTDDAYRRHWQPVWSSAEKSEAYALQWFSFAVISLLLFIVLNLKKTEAG